MGKKTKPHAEPRTIQVGRVRELDRQVLLALGVKESAIFIPSWDSDDPASVNYWWISSGKPRRTHMIDACPIPRFCENANETLAALARFVWSVERDGPLFRLVWPRDGAPFVGPFDPSFLVAACLAILLHAGITVEIVPGSELENFGAEQCRTVEIGEPDESEAA